MRIYAGNIPASIIPIPFETDYGALEFFEEIAPRRRRTTKRRATRWVAVFFKHYKYE